jgi:hypothetical protein
MADSQANLLIITATITPPLDAPQLARTDPKIRLNDYRKALEFYLSCLVDKKISGLVFADNSASDISELQNLCLEYDLIDKIEFISFSGLDYPPSYGRGYGEFKMIEYVMEHSQLIQKLPERANIWKVTGRYIIRNLENVLKTRPSDSDFYCQCRDIPMYWIDLYVLCWKKKAYDVILKNIYQLIREDNVAVSSEQVFRKIIDEQNSDLKVVKRFRAIPELEGIRGKDNQVYQSKKVKLLLRKVANLLVPGLWI